MSSDYWNSRGFIQPDKKIDTIIQNAYFDKKPLSRELLDRQYDIGKQVILAFMAFFGKDYVYRDLEKEFYAAFSGDRVSSRRTRKLLRRIDCLNDFKNDNSNLLGAAVVNRAGKSILVLK